MKKFSGFTLIELMIVVAIIGILAAIAVPNYFEHVARSKITEATSTLSDMRVRMEQFYQDNRNYGSTAAACGVANPTGRYFTYTCNFGPTASDQGFRATATNRADAGLGAAGAYVFDIDQSNVRRTTAFPGAAGLPKNCFINNKGGTC